VAPVNNSMYSVTHIVQFQIALASCHVILCKTTMDLQMYKKRNLALLTLRDTNTTAKSSSAIGRCSSKTRLASPWAHCRGSFH
jgi:argininosuccinate lyase